MWRNRSNANGQTQVVMSRDSKFKVRPVKKTGAYPSCGKEGNWIAYCLSRIQEYPGQHRYQRENIAQEQELGDYLLAVCGGRCGWSTQERRSTLQVRYSS